MADRVKTKEIRIPNYILTYFPSDRTTSIVIKEKISNVQAIHQFLKNPEIPSQVSHGVKIEVHLKNVAAKNNNPLDTIMIAASDMFLIL